MNQGIAITGELPVERTVEEDVLRRRFGFQKEMKCHFMIADYQALAREGIHGCAMQRAVQATVRRYLAGGFDPERSICFLQSQVPQLAEMTMIFSNLVPLAELLKKRVRRFTQARSTLAPFGRDRSVASFGEVGYPVSQAADILTFGARHVLALERHRENVELAQAVAKRFNDAFGEVFTIPSPVVYDRGAIEEVRHQGPESVDDTFVRDVLNLGGSEARIRAQQTLERVREAMGM